MDLSNTDPPVVEQGDLEESLGEKPDSSRVENVTAVNEGLHHDPELVAQDADVA